MQCIVELIGPCRFSHWGDDGEPVGKWNDTAYIQIAAVSKDQTENTRDLFPSMLPQRTRTAYAMEIQTEIVRARHGQVKIKAVAANPRSLEGGRVSFLVAGEPHHWTKSNGGEKFYRTASNNLTKFGGRMLVITNAFEPGEMSVAELIRNEQEKVWAGLLAPTGWLTDSIEGHPKAPLTPDWAPFVVNTIKGDAYWLDTAAIVLAIQDSSIPVNTHRRYWFNQITASDDAFFSPPEWEAIKKEGTFGDIRDLERGDEIVLGFDGGKTDDATALVAIRIKDRLIVPILIEEKPEGPRGENWHIDEQLVDEAVRRTLADYAVRAFFADVALWESYIARWSEDYRETLLVKASTTSTIGWDMRGNREQIARGTEAFLQTVVDGQIFHNGSPLLKRHALNAKRGHNGKGLIFRKDNPESPRKIDALAAAFVAFMALNKYLESGKKPATQYRRRMVQA